MSTRCRHLGIVYGQQGKNEEALVQFHQALEIQLQVLGSEHPTSPPHTLILGTCTASKASTSAVLEEP